ncbi:hypothetical protein ABZ513_14730 [Streptomyces bacillaris]|uniref:hypothetical protein n=1 Tax=Streptomyces bacillaris TaxID=68179 RepID=UPI0034613915
MHQAEIPNAASWEQTVPPDVAGTADQVNWYFNHIRLAIPQLAEQGSATGPSNVSYFASADPELTTRLWLRVGSDRSTAITFALTGPREKVREERPRWRAVLATALETFRADPAPEHRWAAILIPKAAQLARWTGPLRTWPDRLETPVGVGPMTLTSVRTWVTQPHPHPDDTSIMLGVGYWPLLVTGQAPGYYRAGALQAAARDLLRLQWLLTLVTARTWQRGSQPCRMEPDSDTDDFTAQWLERMTRWSLREQLPAPDPMELNLPGWLQAAWEKSLTSRRCSNALSAYGRAFEYFTEEATSDAGARFAAVIEAITGTHSHSDATKTAAQYLLSATAPGTLTEPEAAQAAENILMYSFRHQTVHFGRLHGPESLGGMGLGMLSADGDPSRTHHMMTGVLQHLCRDILIHNLGGPAHAPEGLLQELDDIGSGWITIGPPIPK